MRLPLLTSLLVSATVLCAAPATAESESTLLSSEQLDEILGTSLTVQQWELNSPNGPSLTTPAECRTTSNATTTLVYGATWTSYEGSSYADGEDGDYRIVVGQIVGVFPTPKAASAVFATLVKGLRSCGSKTSVEHRASGNLTWRNAVDQITPTSASWHSLLNNKPSWRCSLNAQLDGTAVVEASVCRFVAPTSAAQANLLANQVKAITTSLIRRSN